MQRHGTEDDARQLRALLGGAGRLLILVRARLTAAVSERDALRTLCGLSGQPEARPLVLPAEPLLLRPLHTRVGWGPHADAVLRAVVAKRTPRSPSDWDEVAADVRRCLPAAHGVDCWLRWASQPWAVVWTRHRLAALQAAVALHGCHGQWVAIAAAVGGTPFGCLERYRGDAIRAAAPSSEAVALAQLPAVVSVHGWRPAPLAAALAVMGAELTLAQQARLLLPPTVAPWVRWAPGEEALVALLCWVLCPHSRAQEALEQLVLDVPRAVYRTWRDWVRRRGAGRVAWTAALDAALSAIVGDDAAPDWRAAARALFADDRLDGECQQRWVEAREATRHSQRALSRLHAVLPAAAQPQPGLHSAPTPTVPATHSVAPPAPQISARAAAALLFY